MFERILVAIDHSDLSQPVFQRAIALAQAMGSHLMFLHALSPGENGSPEMPLYPHLSYSPALDESVWEVYQKRWEAYQEEAIQRLQSYADTANDMGIPAEITQTPGMPGKVICNLARTWKADLILMGTQGRSGLSELFLGSVSNYVTHHAPCSVMLVRGGTDESTQPTPEREAIATS